MGQILSFLKYFCASCNWVFFHTPRVPNKWRYSIIQHKVSCHNWYHVSWRILRILCESFTDLFSDLFQDLWIMINWQGKYPLPLTILSIYDTCKLNNNRPNLWKYSLIYSLIFLSRSLSENHLTGEIPSYIGNLANLQYLYVEEQSSRFYYKWLLIYSIFYIKRFAWKSIDRRNTLFH
jgi:hypothetical protein